MEHMHFIDKLAIRIRAPRTRVGYFLRFLGAAACLAFVMGVGIFFYWHVLGFGKPRATLTGALFWTGLFLLWKKIVPSQKSIEDFRRAEEALEQSQRVAELEQSLARGDARAAAALGEIYYCDKFAEQDLQRALHYFDIAAIELPKAKRKATVIRAEIALAEANKRRAELEAKVPDILDASCPNCKALLGISSAKCHQCGALFFVNQGGWTPVALPSAQFPPTTSVALASKTQETRRAGTFAVGDSNTRLAGNASREVEELRAGRNLLVIVVVLYPLVLMLSGVAAEILALATVALSMFAAAKLAESIGYSSTSKVVVVVVVCIPLIGFITILGLLFKASWRLRQLGHGRIESELRN
ncbi:MAG: hypothetical protein CFE44_12745 [Burkholderiales bacterium PBB4]|nr:MAG: hypothetical protein CFE44_12745 [Burkholderiales bacterium PBB4]